jgi:hypothetical protein
MNLGSRKGAFVAGAVCMGVLFCAALQLQLQLGLHGQQLLPMHHLAAHIHPGVSQQTLIAHIADYQAAGSRMSEHAIHPAQLSAIAAQVHDSATAVLSSFQDHHHQQQQQQGSKPGSALSTTLHGSAAGSRVVTTKSGHAIVVPPWLHSTSTAHHTAQSGADAHDSSSSSRRRAYSRVGISASEGLALTAAYSRALSALSDALMQARQRAEEVTALKAALDDLRLRQYKQTHPEATEQRVNALLLGNEPQQQQKQQQQPQQQQQPKQQSASSGRDAPAAPPAPAAAAAANTNTSRVWGEQHEGRKQIRIFIGVYVSPNMAPVESSIFAILVTITSRLDDHG